MKIKAYIGVIGSGKDYKCAQECTHKVSFADEVREDVWKLIGWKPKTPEEYEQFKTAILCAIDVDYEDNSLAQDLGFTGRKLLQNYAELQKTIHSPNYWIYRTMDKLEKLHTHRTEDTAVGITDCRFPNEITALINFANEFNCDLEFVHCDFESSRYNRTSDHPSETLAQRYAGRNFTPGEFNKLIHKLYADGI